ncbi:MAG: hypothetical protein OWQ54_09840 [Sulfolobaceae archaeon]|nr:hypothetical protein [Sulfolobaceae archaeon]
MKVYKDDEKLALVINNVISVSTNKPSNGPLCSPSMLSSPSAQIQKMQIISQPSLTVEVEGKRREVSIVVTNIAIYPTYRDVFGAPCVSVSTVTLY